MRQVLVKGTVIFGWKGFDKVDGPLVAQPIVNDQTLAITLGSVTVNGQTFQSEMTCSDTVPLLLPSLWGWR